MVERTTDDPSLHTYGSHAPLFYLTHGRTLTSG